MSRIKLEVWARRGIRRAGLITRQLLYLESGLIATLIGNNLAVIAASSLMAFYLGRVMNGFWIVAVSSSILLLFGEILPKSFARDRSANILRFTVYIFIFFKYIFHPATKLISWLSATLLRSFKTERTRRDTLLTRQYLGSLVIQGTHAGAVNEIDSSIISKFIAHGNKRVRKIMVPRTEVQTVPVSADISEVIELFEQTGFSRIPVVEEHIDDVKGMITAKDVLISRPGDITDILRKCFFVPEVSTILDAFKQMQEAKESSAIVVDEYGGVSGLVSMEDIVEEFLGEIYDEYDEDEIFFRNVTPVSVEVKAKSEIQDLNEKFSLGLPKSEYQSLGGLLMDRAGKIPKRGEVIDLETCTVTVVSGSRKRINWVRIEKKQ